MFAKIFTGIAVLLALISILDSYSQKSAFVLREEKQENYSPRYETQLSGSYDNRGVWIYTSTTRSYYSDFQGGGPGSGK
ncbi:MULTISPECIES: hypothetical protein [Nostocales]|uniref:Uncharacterized protein n=3 Tax=Nostocales TaxID=1161 RepID=A0A0C1NED6_9CYAN|nr:hypothetical protein [Tolypothrix bouteillei]KAF3887861.1 hypothetical protein DA73_0400021975 [Tolypothrix bouteillei VB521301]